jgi:hypothetical protein
MMAPNGLVDLAAALREALAEPESLVAVSIEEQEARRDIIDLIPEFNAALVGDNGKVLAGAIVNLRRHHSGSYSNG